MDCIGQWNVEPYEMEDCGKNANFHQQYCKAEFDANASPFVPKEHSMSGHQGKHEPDYKLWIPGPKKNFIQIDSCTERELREEGAVIIQQFYRNRLATKSSSEDGASEERAEASSADASADARWARRASTDEDVEVISARMSRVTSAAARGARGIATIARGSDLSLSTRVCEPLWDEPSVKTAKSTTSAPLALTK